MALSEHESPRGHIDNVFSALIFTQGASAFIFLAPSHVRRNDAQMKIVEFQVVGLLGRSKNIQLKFHDDLNILTGYNGSGKTTVLKLIWYIVSGNIHIALREIPFKRCVLITDIYSISILKVNETTCEAEVTSKGKSQRFEDQFDHEEDILNDARDNVKDFTQSIGTSLFFPTFRRIEGGFGIDEQEPGIAPRNTFAAWSTGSDLGNLQKAVSAVSRRLSNGKHTFVTSIATNDISELIQGKYTDLSEQANSMQREVNQSVVQDIQNYKLREDQSSEFDKDQDASALLEEVRKRIEQATERRNAIMQPLSAVQQLVVKIFRHKGIKMTGRVSFGDAADAIASDKLSAGEKQMLSFICYNALTYDSVIFIDEPELSLHVDWQRVLFPTLMQQSKSNQFIIATHSPFIYSKYPDRELLLSELRGDERAEED